MSNGPIFKLIRALNQERHAVVACDVLSEEFRQFRSMQALNRMTTAEGALRRKREVVAAAIEEYQKGLDQ